MKLLFVIIFLLVFTETAYGYSDEVCMTLNNVNLEEARQKLEADAKKKAVEALLGSEIICKTMARNYQINYNEIISRSQGHIKISFHHYDSKGVFGNSCIKFDASVSEDYIEKIRPKRVNGTGTVTDGDMSTARERAKTEAKLDALCNYNERLKNYKNQILPLLTEVKIISQEPKERYFRIEIEGIVSPLEVEFFLDSQATSTQEHREQPAANHQVNRQERGRERFNCADIELKMTMGEMSFSPLTQEEENFYNQNCQKNTLKRRKK